MKKKVFIGRPLNHWPKKVDHYSWRELRKINKLSEGLLNLARIAADDGNWEDFTNLFGGTEVLRKHQPIRLYRDYNDELGRYGEPKGETIKGVTDGLEIVITRIHNWKISKACDENLLASSAGLGV